MRSTFDALHSVSDLHLGGETGRQIFKGTDLLAGFVDTLTAEPAGTHVALVINGDVFDFLAEPNAVAFDPNAASKLHRILADASFAPIVAALQRFVATADRYLVFVLGNHDLELRLREVQATLLDALTDGDAAAQGRIEFCLDGAGFAAQVGTARVLCVHGNDVDPWNATDYERLRRIERDRQFGVAFDAWVPNAGSKMVVDVMNGIKRDLPFVDLLKPETDAVVPILLALDQGSASRLRGAAAVARKLTWDATRRAFGFLGEGEDEGGPGSIDPLLPILARVDAHQSGRSANHVEADQLLAQAEQQLASGVDPLQVAQQMQDGTLGIGDLASSAWNWVKGGSRVETLRRALRPLVDDQSFNMKTRDDTFEKLDAAVTRDVQFLIVGHTHLERSLRRCNGSGHYFNTGTWARLIRLDPKVLESEARFQPVFEQLQAPRLDLLDAVPDLVIHRPTVASVERTPSGVRGTLGHVEHGANGYSVRVISEGGAA